MAGANIKVGVTGVNEFKQEINKVKQSVQTLNSALALNEKQFKASGNAEEYLKTKAELLNGKIEAQTKIIAEAEKALDAMKSKGVDKASAAFQGMQRTLLSAKSELVDAQTQLKNLGTDAGEAEKGAKGMNEELKKIGQGVSWKNVSDGIGKITDKLENAGRAAIRLGKSVINSAKDSTGWADDLLTRSQQMGVDVETLQRMDRAAEFIDTDVDTIVTAKDKLAKNRGKLPDLMGISTDGKSDEDLFWEVGEALAGMGEGFDKAETAQDIFGKSWRELAPLFAAGRQEYESLMEGQNVLTEDQVKKLGEADDAIKSVELELQRMKNEFWSNNAEKITGLFQWFIDNKEAVTGALIAIGGGFAAMKLAETASNVMEIVSGLRTLGFIKGAGTAAGAGASAASGASTAGAAATGTAGGGIGLAGWGGMMGLAAIGAGFEWAKNRRNNTPELVRGTDENFMARSGNPELTDAFVRYIRAQKAAEDSLWDDSTAVGEYTAAQEAFTKMQGWQEMMDAYSDWRQENSAKMGDLPDFLDRFNQVAEELTGGSDKQNKTNSEMAAAVAGLEGLPGEIATAVSKAPISVNIDGTMMTNYFNTQLGPALAAANQ